MSTKQRYSMWSGWITYPAVMLILIGLINVLQGIVVIANRERTVVMEDRLYVVNLVGWGILVLVFGAILAGAGVGLLSARTWARVLAIVCVAVHMIVQVASLAAYPLWSLLMLGLDVAVMYALTAAWHDATTAPEHPRPPIRDPRDQQAMWDQHPRIIA
jgi:hypothetical protein